MIRLGLRISDGGLADKLKRSPETVARVLRQWAVRGYFYTRNSMVEEIRTRQKGGGGYLRKTVTGNIAAAGFSVFPTADYADFVDQPTRPHDIRPRNRKSLAFPQSGGTLTRSKGGTVATKFNFGGRTTTTSAVFAKVVHHPGTTGMFFEDATVTAIREPVRADLEQSLNEAAKDY
jgi:hypothetical protein